MTIPSILQTHRRILVIGISPNPDRPSHWISKYLVEQGYDVIGVNPVGPTIDGVKVVQSLSEIDDPLEIVNVFRSPEAIPALVEELTLRKPKVLWLQPGAQNPQAQKKAEESGMIVISGPCIFKEHSQL